MMTEELRNFASEETDKLSVLGKSFADKIHEFNEILSGPMKDLEEKIEKIIGKKVEDVTDEEEDKILQMLPEDIKTQYELLINIKSTELDLYEIVLDYRNDRINAINKIFDI